MVESKDPLEQIRKYVNQERNHRHITALSISSLPEGSCFTNGEMNNLLFQLINTHEPYGDWQIVINNPEVIKLLLNYINTDF